MATIAIDGVTYQVNTNESLLAVCLGLGLDLPYFCWHPALGSAGACRQCAVMQFKDADDSRGRMVMACMTPVKDAMRIAINHEQARQFRKDNIELLMTNHPHDCPVCEEGGECHLQDMTLMTGHTIRSYRGTKRSHNNQYLGPFINHEMNRCIACYRCVRFYDDYAGGKDLQALGMHNNVYFGRFQDGVLENEFSGNLVEVCPTGVFTDKTFSDHYVRKWDLQTAPSVCTHCSLGCNISPGERAGELRRIVNRYNSAVNGYFLCDRGRFGYGFVNSPNRIKSAVLNRHTKIDTPAAEQHLRQLLKLSEPAQPVLGIGSPRASLEANFALRQLVGADNFYLGLEDGEQTLLEAIVQLLEQGGIQTPSLHEIEKADAVLILGEDLTNSAPRMALSVRQAARNAAFDQANAMNIPIWQDAAVRVLQANNLTPVFIACSCGTRLDDVAAECFHGSPQAIARLGFAIAHYLNTHAPATSGLTESEEALAAGIAQSLQTAKRPLVISGTGCASLAVIQAAYNVAKALPQESKQLTFAVPECNSLGLAMMGGKRLQTAFAMIKARQANSIIILENDLYRRAQAQQVDECLQIAEHVLVIDSLVNKTTEQAELLLPSATFAESEGTWVNNEGRAQRYFPVFAPVNQLRASWQWLSAVMPDPQWQYCDQLTAACASEFPLLADIILAAPEAVFRIKGQKIPRQSHRYSGRTALYAKKQVSEVQQTVDKQTPFAYSMEGAITDVPPALLPQFWAPGWNSNQAVNKFQQEIKGQLRGGDAGVRLFTQSGMLDWFKQIPDAFIPEQGYWRVLLLQHIFGSEELSNYSPPIIERLVRPYGMLNPVDADLLNLETGDLMEIANPVGLTVLVLPVRIEATLSIGLLGLPAGLPESLAVIAFDRVMLQKLQPSGNQPNTAGQSYE